MSKKDLLKQKAKSKLATSIVKADEETKVVAISGNAELRNITREIKSDLDEMRDISEWWAEKKFRVNELKENIITKLIFVRDNKKNLLPDQTFESYLVDDIGISKGYFYEQLQAYNVCVEYKKPKLFKEIDHKVLVNIAREDDKEKQKELIGMAGELNRDYFKKVKAAVKVSPPDFSVKKTSSGIQSNQGDTPASIAISLIDTFKNMMEKESKEDTKSSIRCMILGIQSFSDMLHDKQFISDDDLSVIKQLLK